MCLLPVGRGGYRPTNRSAFRIVHSLRPVRHVATPAEALPDHLGARRLPKTSGVGGGQSQATSVISIQTLKAQLPLGPPEVFGKGSAFPCSFPGSRLYNSQS